jgi:hypothetical protein
MKPLLLSIAATFLVLSSTSVALASSGTIDTNNSFAWSDNGGWVNWAANGGNISVSDTTLTGYIWSANFGWINLAPTNGGVVNTGGYLSGYAWGASTGWVSFLGVTIDQSGVFHGHTVAQNIFGTMTFDCDNCKVVATWRQTSTTANTGGGGTVSGPLSPGYQSTKPSTGSTSSPQASSGQATTLPPTLIPTSKPSTSPQPTTKPPASSKSPTYTSQTPLVPVFPTSTVRTTQKSTNSTGGGANSGLIYQSNTCTWMTCWWQSVTSFFSNLFTLF